MPSLVNGLSGTVTSNGTTPITGVTVAISPGTMASTTTDASGRFSFASVPIGSYQLTFTVTGYNSQTAIAEVSLAGPTTVSVVLNRTPGSPPTVALNDVLNGGYNTAINVTATVTGSGPFTYAWSTSNTAVTLSNANSASVTVQMPKFIDALGYSWPNGTTGGGTVLPDARCDVRGIDRDQAVHTQLSVVVTDANGLSTKSTANVYATRPTTGLRNVPLGIPVWLEGNGPEFPLMGGATQTTWNWQITSKPVGSNAALYAQDGAQVAYTPGAAGQYAYFIPDVPTTANSAYVLTESVSGTPEFGCSSNCSNPVCTVTIHTGTWGGIMTVTGPKDTPAVSTTVQAQTCKECHSGPASLWIGSGGAPDFFTPWSSTRHATALQRKIEGSAGPSFGESCLECHVVGYDKSNTVQNDGFSDLERKAGWTYPSSNVAGNWSALESLQTPPTGFQNSLADLAGIQCENCHGPQNTDTNAHSFNPTDPAARTKWSEQVCASCHQEYSQNYFPSQWAKQNSDGNGGHSNRVLALQEGGGGSNHCTRCHAAQGFAIYAKNLSQNYYALQGAYTSGSYTIAGPVGAQVPGAATGTLFTLATAAQLSALGLNKQLVEPQTCQACHDSHDNTAGGTCPNGTFNGVDCSQLRIYDSIASLPNGLNGVSGLGAGAVCVACHNSRNGEHTDFQTQVTQSVNMGTSGAPVWFSTGVMVLGPLVSFTTPHTPAQSDVFFGFNAYFGDRLAPSAHLAVTDTCAGCHSMAGACLWSSS